MALNLTKLMKYDLIEDVEIKMRNQDNFGSFFVFFDIYQQIITNNKFIRDCPAYPGSTDKILRSELVSSIGATLAIEGTRLTEQEIEESLEKADLNKELERTDQETNNSRNAYENIRKLVGEHRKNHKGEFIYSEEHIKNIHRDITDNIDYIGNVPGQYRDINPIFGVPPKRSLCEKKYTVETAMSKLINWLNEKANGPLSGNPIIKAIMAHYYLTEIHPFGDGNGRTSRALEALVLYVNGINTYCFRSLANFWSLNRNEYLVRLGNIRVTCDPWDFLIWGLNGYLKEIERIKDRVLKKAKRLMLMDYVQWLLKSKKHQKPEKKINQRIVGILALLTRTGEVPFDKFLSFSELTTLYHKRADFTRYRDFEKMSKLGLISFSTKDNTKYIEPNYKLLEYLEYEI